MMTLSLTQSTGDDQRAEAMVDFYELDRDLSGQSITLDGRNNLNSTSSFCARLLQILLIERQAASVKVQACRKEVEGLFEKAATELGASDRLDVQPRAEGSATVIVNLTELTVARVKDLSVRYEMNKTDVLNRAVALYDMLDEIDRTGELYVRNIKGELNQLHLTGRVD